MPAAPDRETVMDFEGALEQGFQALYTTAGLTTYIRNSTYDPEGTPVADTHTEISVEVGPADENQVDFDPRRRGLLRRLPVFPIYPALGAARHGPHPQLCRHRHQDGRAPRPAPG
jgi:hypothetical protein